MIKINLKGQKASNGPAKQINIDSKVLKSLNISKITLDSSVFIILIAAILLAAFPHLFFLKYERHVRETIAGNMEELNKQEVNLNSEIANFKTLQDEMKGIEESEKKLMQKLDVVKTLQGSRKGLVNVLDVVGQLLPERVWVSRLEFNLNPTPSLQISGKSLSNSDVSDYVSKLTSSVYFEKVNLDSLSTQREGEKLASTKEFFVYAVPKF